MASLIEFMHSFWGRALRVIVGVALIAYGLAGIGGTGGVIVAIIGLVPLIMGAWGRCLLELAYHPAHRTV